MNRAREIFSSLTWTEIFKNIDDKIEHKIWRRVGLFISDHIIRNTTLVNHVERKL